MFFSAMSVIFRHKSNFPIAGIDQSMIANGYLMGVSSEVFDDLFGAKEGSFAVDHPFFLKQDFVDFWMEIKMHSDLLYKTSSKDFADGFHRKKIFVFALSSLPFFIGINATTRNNAVQMWMKGQVLSPGMKNANHARFPTYKFGIGSEVSNHAPSGFKEN